MQEISPAEVKELFPLAEVDDMRAGFYAEHDGRINPVDVTMALAKGARMKGVKLLQNTPVQARADARWRGNRRAHRGQGKSAVNSSSTAPACGRGNWANSPACVIPNQAAEHYYLITERIDGVPKDLPVLEDPSIHAYYREEGGGLMIGMFEPECAPWKVEGIPEDFSFGEIPPDWDRLMPFLEQAMEPRARSPWKPASASFSAVRKVLPRTSPRSSARRLNCVTISSRRA